MNTNILNADVAPRAEALNLFGDLLLACEKVPYQKEWSNNTGYMNGIPRIEESFENTVRFVDPSGRNGLIIWDAISSSNVAIFERYADSSGCLVYNVNDSFRTAHSTTDDLIGGSGLVYDKPAMVRLLKRTLELASVQERLKVARAALAG